nr:protein GLUTAMINE DUMPER 6-like [Ipomoea batatas]GMC54560.1 protein GLUTAMINE DUMPER 6-like [Ipomoea batatas]
MDGVLSFGTITAYIFLATILLLLGLMLAYLLIFFCSECKPASESSAGDGNKEMAASSVTGADHTVVVIMAGDSSPTFLATPAPSPSRHTEEI